MSTDHFGDSAPKSIAEQQTMFSLGVPITAALTDANVRYDPKVVHVSALNET